MPDTAGDDGRRALSLTVTPLRTAQGGAVMAWRDVSARRQAERALRASEALHRAMVMGLHDGVIVFDAEAHPQGCNAAAERILGVSQQEMRIRHMAPADWPALRADGSPMPAEELPLSRVLATGEALKDAVLGYRRRDGGLVWMNVNAEPMRDAASGRLDGVVVSFADITQRKHAEEALALHQQQLQQRIDERTQALQQALQAQQVSETFWRTVADNQPTLIAYWDRERRLRFANRAYLAWIGQQAEAVLGRTVSEVVGEARAASRAASMERLFSGEVLSGSEEIPGADGRSGHFWIHRLPDTRDGVVQGYFFFATDISELKQAEQPPGARPTRRSPKPSSARARSPTTCPGAWPTGTPRAAAASSTAPTAPGTTRHPSNCWGGPRPRSSAPRQWRRWQPTSARRSPGSRRPSSVPWSRPTAAWPTAGRSTCPTGTTARCAATSVSPST